MSNTQIENMSNSKSNLIDVQHVGVTAKLQSPLKNLLVGSTSSDTENAQILYNTARNVKSKYDKLSNDSMDTEDPTTESSKILYEMRTLNRQQYSTNTLCNNKINKPAKIEFQLYRKPMKRHHHYHLQQQQQKATNTTTQRHKSKRCVFNRSRSTRNKCYCKEQRTESSIFQRLRHSFENMRNSKTTQTKCKSEKLLGDLPEPQIFETEQQQKQKQQQQQEQSTPIPTRDARIGIYPFEHGCAEYLRTTDCHPQILSIILAERATHYATRFWAEFFGSLQIGISFVVTFLLQTYRFILYSLINTLLVGLLHMSSDYFLKPLLTVIFNGFIQPPLIFIYNILSTTRDALEPVADSINNFAKPIATMGNSLRLVQINYKKRKLIKDV